MTAIADRLASALSDRYRIERELGQGGMATVYLAEDLKHKRRVALKVLKPELAAVLGAERFVQEITTTASLQHPHILPLFDSGTADGFLFYVMPYIEGETLRDKLNRETQLGVAEAVRIARDVADALEYAHGKGVIHRDIKPENILLANGRPMVADFGIALAVSAAAGGRMTETGLSLGTPHYMSPEQATADKDITARSDVYSLASVLYEMLTGNPPHTGASAQQIIMKIVTDTPRPVTELRKSVPPNVADALMTALEKLPADRFAGAREFADALADESRRTRRHASGTMGATRQRWLVWIPTAVAIAAIAALAMIVARRPGPTPTKPLRFLLARLDEGDEERGLSISSDGRLVVYLATAGGVRRAYRRALADMLAEPLPGTEGALMVTASPDGRSVAVAGKGDQVAIIPADGGRGRTVVKTTLPAGMSWSAHHGLILGMPAYTSNTGLNLVPEAGDTALTPLTHPKPGDMHHVPYVLPDGETVLFVEITESGSGGRRARIAVGTLTGKRWETTSLSAERIVGLANDILVYRDGGITMAVRWDPATHRPVGDPVRINGMPDGVREATMASDGTLVMRVRADRYQVALLNERGEGDALLPDTIPYLIPRISPDGGRVALSAGLRGSAQGVWLLNLADRTLSKLKFPESDGLDWSRDGKRIVAGWYRDVMWQSADNSDEPVLLQRFPEVPLDGVALSPDGSAVVAVTGFQEGGFNILMHHIGGDTATVPLVSTNANEYAPRFSPDGRWLAYTSDETGRPEVYLRPFPVGGAPIQISLDGGGQAVWSGDGRHIYYRAGRAFMVADLSVRAAGSPPVVTARRKLFEGSYYGSGAESPSATYDVSPDGHHFVVARTLGDGSSELVVWMGWMQELRAQLGIAGR